MVNKGENPYIEVPVRSLSNIVWDEKAGLLRLGESKAKRYFFHVGHARKFMQTMLVAAFCEDLLDENIHTSIRDMYYNLKRTLPGTRENTFETQDESNPIIVDLETSLNVLREQLHLIADRKGVVVGNVVIEDRGDEIDWSKLGSGGWSIPSSVEDIKFKHVDADFLLVVEKNAAWERLHEDKFWKKHHCILIGTGGQAARGTRRLIRRLNKEFNLPVYVMTDADSIPPWETVVIRHRETKDVFIGPIEELLKRYINENKEREIIKVPWETLAMDKETGRIKWMSVDYAYRHRVNGELLEIHTRGRGVIEVTPAHSLFVFRDGRISEAKASEIKEGDYIVVGRKLPRLSTSKRFKRIIVAELLEESVPKEKWNRFYLIFNDGSKILMSRASNPELRKAKYIRHVNGYQMVVNRIVVDEDVGWLLGLWVAEGDVSSKYIKLHLSAKEEEKVDRVERVAKEKFGVEVTFRLEGKRKTGISVSIGSSVLAKVFKSLGLVSGSRKKRVPSIILNSPPSVQKAFLKGLFDGDGHVDKYNNIVYFTNSDVLAKQVVSLLLSIGVLPTVVKARDGMCIRVPYTRMPIEVRKEWIGKIQQVHYYTNDSIYGLPNSGVVKSISIYWMNNFGFPYSVKSNLINQLRFIDATKTYGVPERFRERFGGLTQLMNGEVTLVKVKKVVRKKYRGNVYDLAVPGHNSFVGSNGVVFHNSYGWYIYSVIKAGSMNLAHTSELLGTPTAKFIGLSASDIKEYGLENFTIKATERDIKRAKELLNYPWFQHKEWQKEIKLMIKMGRKAELEALSSKGLRFITNTYLPEKLKEKKFLP